MGYNSPLSYTGLQSGDGNLCMSCSVSVVGCVCMEMLLCISVCRNGCEQWWKEPLIELVQFLGFSTLLKPSCMDFFGHLWARERRHIITF